MIFAAVLYSLISKLLHNLGFMGIHQKKLQYLVAAVYDFEDERRKDRKAAFLAKVSK